MEPTNELEMTCTSPRKTKRRREGGRVPWLPWLNGKVPEEKLSKYPLETGKLDQQKPVVRNKNEGGSAEGFGISQRHNMKINKRKLLNYKRCKQAGGEPKGSVEYQGAMGTIKGDKDTAGKLNDLFACHQS